MNRKIKAMSIVVCILLVAEKIERSVEFSSPNKGGDRNG